MKHLLIGFVHLWRKLISPLYGDVCKYYPTCSTYGLEALRVHGAIKGSALTIWRLLRCNPWSQGGIDPVPGSAYEAQWLAEESAEDVNRRLATEDDAHGHLPGTDERMTQRSTPSRRGRAQR